MVNNSSFVIPCACPVGREALFCAGNFSPLMPDELKKIAEMLGLEKYRRHIFLCADSTKPKCAPPQAGLESWEFLKRRL